MKITVYTDHLNLTYCLNTRLQKVQRWFLLISEYNIALQYKRGSDNNCADTLYRMSILQEVKSRIDISHPIKNNIQILTEEQIKKTNRHYHQNYNHPGESRLRKFLRSLFPNTNFRSFIET